MKIVSAGGTISTTEYYERMKKERRRKFTLWSAGIFALLIILVLVSRIGSLQIKQVKVEGAKVVTEEEISRVTLDTLSKKYFWLVPKSNVALYPGDEAAENLMAAFPRISSVSFSLTGTSELLASVTEREPFALYCPPAEASTCFFLDEEGFIFDEAPAFSGAVYLVYSGESAIENPKGSEFLRPEEFAPISGFIESVSNLGFEPVSAEVGERDITLSTKNGSRLIWGRRSDPAILYSNLESFLKNPAIEMNRLSELDLRIENKIFWKLFGNN